MRHPSECYGDGDLRLVDVQQIIPLAEAQEYPMQLKQKEQVGRKMRAERYDIRLRFWQGLAALARTQKTRHANIRPNSTTWMSASSGFSGLSLDYVAVQEYALVELDVDRRDTDENKRIFDQLHARRDEIEKAFGNPLSWERLDAKRACRLNYRIDLGGYRSPEIQWPQIHDAMIRAMSRLEAVLVPVLTSLGL